MDRTFLQKKKEKKIEKKRKKKELPIFLDHQNHPPASSTSSHFVDIPLYVSVRV